jgi:hypothetical protein
MPVLVLGFVFRDASSSAFSSFLATILHIYLLEPCPHHTCFGLFLFGSTCEIMDVPLLPPLPLPEGHGVQDNAITNDNAVQFLVQQYFIKGVHNLPKELRSHVIVYYKELITLIEGASESCWGSRHPWRMISPFNVTSQPVALKNTHSRHPIGLQWTGGCW